VLGAEPWVDLATQNTRVPHQGRSAPSTFDSGGGRRGAFNRT
jgi:hypothetical protein